MKAFLAKDELAPGIALALTLAGGLIVNLSGQKAWLLVGGALLVLALLVVAADSFRGTQAAQETPAAVVEEPRAADTGVAEAARRGLGLAAGLAEDAYQQGNFATAVGLWGEALEMARGLRDFDGMAALLNNRGLALAWLGRYDEALADFDRSLALRPDDPDTLTNRGAALARLVRYDAALADFDRSLALRPDDPDTLTNRGAALARLGRYDEALADYERSLALAERAKDARGLAIVRHNLALLVAGQKWDEATRLLTLALETFDKLKAPEAATTRRVLEVLAEAEAQVLTAEIEAFLRQATIMRPAEPVLVRA